MNSHNKYYLQNGKNNLYDEISNRSLLASAGERALSKNQSGPVSYANTLEHEDQGERSYRPNEKDLYDNKSLKYYEQRGISSPSIVNNLDSMGALEYRNGKNIQNVGRSGEMPSFKSK